MARLLLATLSSGMESGVTARIVDDEYSRRLSRAEPPGASGMPPSSRMRLCLNWSMAVARRAGYPSGSRRGNPAQTRVCCVLRGTSNGATAGRGADSQCCRRSRSLCPIPAAGYVTLSLTADGRSSRYPSVRHGRIVQRAAMVDGGSKGSCGASSVACLANGLALGAMGRRGHKSKCCCCCLFRNSGPVHRGRAGGERAGCGGLHV
jgi:hypothetical protein